MTEQEELWWVVGAARIKEFWMIVLTHAVARQSGGES